jgi:acetyl esterase/lipase
VEEIMKLLVYSALAAALSVATPATAEIVEIPADSPSNFVAHMADVTYTTVKGGFARNVLNMDLLIPATEQPVPAIVFVTGNGWQSIDRKVLLPQLSALAKSGYVIASIDYRIIGEAKFPEPEKDVKTAIRFLRANAARFNIDPEKIGLFGNSAGGHLSSFAGTTGGVAEFEGEDWKDQSSAAQAVVAWYAPLYFETLGNKPTDSANLHAGFDLKDPKNAEDVKKLNPATYLDAKDPPFLLVHGTEDKLVAFEHSQRFYDDLKAAGVEATLVKVNGAGHSFGLVSSQPEVNERIQAFFDKHLKAK